MPTQPRPLTNAERTILRRLVATTTSPKAFFEAARARGIKRRESDVLRPFRNLVLDATRTRQLVKAGAPDREIKRAQYEADARRLASIRPGRMSRPANVRIDRVEFPKALFQYEGYVPLIYDQAQRDKLGKAYADLTKEEKRDLEKRGNESARLDAERAIWVSFGSKVPLTQEEVKEKIKKLAANAGTTYGKTMGEPVLTKHVRSYKKRTKREKGGG